VKIIDVKDLPIHPRDEAPRVDSVNWAEFMERTRRYFRLTRNPPSDVHYARGLDSKREDFA